MDSFNESSLSAYFPGLVDVCVNDEGQMIYAILKDGELIFAQEYVTETEILSIPQTGRHGRGHPATDQSRKAAAGAQFEHLAAGQRKPIGVFAGRA